MSGGKGDIPVKTVKVKWTGDDPLTTYDRNVTVKIDEDPATRTSYLLIRVDKRIKMNIDLKDCRWLEASSHPGVATIESPDAKIIIMYDREDRHQEDFVDDLRKHLNRGRSAPKPPLINSERPERSRSRSRERSRDKTDRRQWTAADLVQSISKGAKTDAESAARYLARAKAPIHPHIASDNDREKSKTASKNVRSSKKILEFTLLIECHLKQTPIETKIYVAEDTELFDLKTQIEKETGVSKGCQHWFANEDVLIPDEYVFGASNDPLRIRSGAELVLYIAQTPAVKS